MTSNRGLEERIVEYHRREADDEYYREVGDDAVYDKITWENMEPFLPKDGWILDAGGGSGIWSRKIVETRNCMVELLDITGDLLKTAKKRMSKDVFGKRIEVLQSDIRNVPHPDNSFSFVLSEADPISICGDPEKAVSELARVLKPNCHFVAGVDSTFYRALNMLSQGKPIDHILDFIQTGISPADEEADFDSKSFTPTELKSLLQKHGLKTVRIVGKPIGLKTGMLDIFVKSLPQERRRKVFEDKAEKEKLKRMLNVIYKDPYIAGIGSHLQIIAIKEENASERHQ
ncbi:MAG TPA: class I SAM-dependent methyltransferase [Candidatus Acidoferrum sp.]|nr:class I SAM-dependent methyltransferase [Candidatus Acidoferrum sp.]